MADTELIDHTGRTVFRGTQKPPGGGSQPYAATVESFPFTFEDVQAIWDNGTLSFFTDATNGITYTANPAFVGTTGDGISIETQAPIVPGSLSINVVDTAITVTLAGSGGPSSITTTRAELIAALAGDGSAAALLSAALVTPGTGATIVVASGSPQILGGGVDPSGVNFLPLGTIFPDDELLTAWPSVAASMNNGSEGVAPAARIGSGAAALGTIQWDIHHAPPDDVDPDNGTSSPLADPLDAAAYDTFLGWPKTATLEAELGVIFNDPGGDGAPDVGEVTIRYLIARAPA